MRLMRPYFVTAFLILTTLVVVHLASHGPVSARLVSDSSLARARGTNGGQGGAGSYDCDNVNSTGQGQVTESGCATYTPTNPPPANTTCVSCSDNGSGQAGGTGTPIVFQNVQKCSGQKSTGACTMPLPAGGSTKAVCDTLVPVPNTTCGGSFNVWDPQPVVTPSPQSPGS